MRIVFMGTPDFAVPTLIDLIESKHEVIGVFTQPDRAKGRGGKLSFPPVKEEAIKHQIPVFQPIKIRTDENIAILKELRPDVIIVVAFGQILSPAILELPRFGCINVHASLLPKYRGAAPIQWSIINGDNKTGITIMQMDKGLDTGDILDVIEVPIEERETGASLFDKLSKMGGVAVLKVLDELAENKIIPQKQDDLTATHVKMLTKEMGHISFDASARDIDCYIRGLLTWPGAYMYYQDKQIKIWDAYPIDEAVFFELSHMNTEQLNAFPIGSVCFIDKEGIYVKAKKDLMKITRLQLQGKKQLETDAFLRGFSLEVGDVFL